MDDATTAALTKAELPGLLSLYQYAKERGLIETGSCTIDPSFAPACNYMLERSFEAIGFIPRRLRLYASLRAAGDRSGMFCFGGLRDIDGVWHEVSVEEHIMLIAASIASYEAAHLQKIDMLASTLASTVQIVHVYQAKPPKRPH